jgi:hypothetical protein
MASENLVPLLSLQGFKRVDYSTADPELGPDTAVNAFNCDPTIKRGALLPARGRVQAHDFGALIENINVIFPVVVALYKPLYLVQGTGGVGLVTLLWDPSVDATTLLGHDVPFTEAVQIGEVVYTNGGQRLFLSNASNAITPRFFDWQYPPPPIFTGSKTAVTIALPPGQNGLAQGYYWYIFTRQTIMPDGSVSETSVNLNDFANNASILAGIKVVPPNNAVTIHPVAFPFIGTNDDGTSFTTNLYRQSSNQAGYFLVQNLAVNGDFTDAFSDQQIQVNAMLEVHRDPPPVGTLQGQLIANLGNLAVHKSRAWVFVNFADPEAFLIVQSQVWYSNPGRPWEFDSTAQVLLTDSDVSVDTNVALGYQYNEPYGNAPRGMCEVGTILLAFKQREMWAVLGDDQTNFVARTYFGIGCGAQRTITPVLGGCFWLSESADAYYFDGSQPQYDSKDIRSFIRPIPGSPGIAPADIRAAGGFYADLKWCLTFPTLGITLVYSTVDSAWLGQLPYAPDSANAVAYIPANPNAFGAAATSLNEVIAARATRHGVMDWWFVDPHTDLGVPQTFSWQGPVSASKVFGEKQYSYLTLFAPPGQKGLAKVFLTVDGGLPIEWDIPDLSVPPRALQKSLGSQGGLLRGFMASLAITVQGVPNEPPPQIWSVDLWGQLPSDRKLVLRV